MFACSVSLPAVVIPILVIVGVGLAQSSPAAAGAPASQPVQLVLPPSGPLAFVGGSGANAKNAEAVLKEFAQAGFTHSWAAVTDLDEDQTPLFDAATATGIRLIFKQQGLKVTALDVARRFKDHPALAGYMLMDEPGAADFPALTKEARDVLAEDTNPAHLVLVNLYPVGATNEQLGVKPYAGYSDYVYKFLSEVPVNLISYDCYPIKRLAVLPGWYQNLDMGFQAMRRSKLPLWVWIASVGMDLTPDPTLGSFRLQMYNNLAYGATGIEHFTYHNHAGMRQACIERDGSRSPTYYMVQQVHKDLQAQAGVFVGSDIRRVRWAGANRPPEVEALQPRGGILTLEAGGQGAIVSELWKDNYRFLVIVNQDYLEPMPLSATWRDRLAVGLVQKDGSVKMLPEPKLDMRVDPGDAAILMWQDRAR